ncbi:DUF456 domain-containing protein [Chloroflexota bacterium]
MGYVLSIIACFVLMFIGLAGVIIPMLPGVPLAWLGLFIFALYNGFEQISIAATVIFFVIMLLTLALDFLAPMLGAKKYRASKWGVIGVFLGFIAGIMVFGLWGIILGPLLGALVGELLGKKQPAQAFKSAVGAFIGFLAGSLLKVIVILIMMGYFISSLS